MMHIVTDQLYVPGTVPQVVSFDLCFLINVTTSLSTFRFVLCYSGLNRCRLRVIVGVTISLFSSFYHNSLDLRHR